MSKAYSFIRELRRRKVFRGAAIYLIAAYGILEVADVIAEPAGLPGWTLTVLFYGALIGFPLAVFLGWRYEFGEHGLVLTKPVSGDQAAVEAIGWKDYLAIGVLTLVSAAVAWRVLPEVVEQDQMQAAAQAILPNSIAVIPFKSRGGDGYLADGLADTVTYMLSQVDGLVVTARTSAYSYRDTQLPVKEIANGLRVAYVLEGSVQHAGDRVQIIASLVEAASGAEVWTNRFARSVTDIFAIQDEIASEVVVALGDSMELGNDRIGEQYRPNLAAFEEVINGRNARYDGSVEGILRAEAHFKRAIELDPNYAIAYVELADNYAQREDIGMREEGVALMRPLVDKALELDPLLAEAHVINSLVLRLEGKRDEVEPALLRALELNPNLVEAHLAYSTWMMINSRHEKAHDHARIAYELDPRNPRVMNHYAQTSWNLAQAEKAVSLSRDVIRMYPDHPRAYIGLARYLQQMGELGDAMRYTMALYRMDPDSLRRLNSVCDGWMQLGADDKVLECREELRRRAPDDLENLKQLAAQKGDYAEAVRIARQHAELEPWLDYRKAQLAFFLEVEHRYDEVIDLLGEQYPDLLGTQPQVNSFSIWPAMMVAHALRATGDVEQSDRLLVAIEDAVEQMRLAQGSGYSLGIEPAQIAAIRGQHDKAIELLDQAIEDGWTLYATVIYIDPKFDPLRDDPRFQAVEQKLRDNLAAHRQWYEQNKDAPLT